ncbi:ciliated left-right organizer metallopeptidase [Phycodurus eques]|uniref:ciliated left-right organizer metallopeptidase n=1 Tax=Phycodurus eques TaxID=693459 RepID=UPI002ACD9ED3|nr:ciliated left-right organizer metallopeptidase [Phycodurus eques]
MAPLRGLWLCLPLLCAELLASPHRCVFDEVQARVRVVRTARRARALSPGEVAPMRIGTWISGESHRLSEREEGPMRATVQRAVRTVASFLSVERASSPLLLRRDINKYCRFLWKNPSTVNYNRCGRANSNYRHETCLDMKIPDDHLAGCEVHPQANAARRVTLRPPGSGVPDVDFLVYLQVQASDRCRSQPGLLAYAAHCQTDTGGRPLAGVVVICRDRLTRLTVQTVVHELFHALGFSKDLFPTWRDCFSASVACSPRGKVTHMDGTGQMRIYTPSVISALQRHLGAVDPELGGPLENSDAPPGGVSSHWESRLLQGSVMLASQPGATRIDPLTLAAFQDMGWYAVNTSRAQSLVWGEGEGALFGSTLTCADNSSSFFCTGSGLGCHHLHLRKGKCQTDPFLDGCRVYKAFEIGSECWKKENERKSSEERRGGELFGSDSRCFFSELTTLVGTCRTARWQSIHGVLPKMDQYVFFPQRFNTQNAPITNIFANILKLKNHRMSSNYNQSAFIVTGRCYRHKCTGPNRYQVQVLGSDWAECPAGGSIQIRGYQGSVFCPDKRLCLDSDVSRPSETDDVFTTGQVKFVLFSPPPPYNPLVIVNVNKESFVFGFKPVNWMARCSRMTPGQRTNPLQTSRWPRESVFWPCWVFLWSSVSRAPDVLPATSGSTRLRGMFNNTLFLCHCLKKLGHLWYALKL